MNEMATIPINPALPSLALPLTITEAGPRARFAWDEFFEGQIRNPHTRTAYQRAVTQFLRWTEARGVSLTQIEPGLVGLYFNWPAGGISTSWNASQGCRGSVCSWSGGAGVLAGAVAEGTHARANSAGVT